MPQRTVRSILAIFTLALVSESVALAQQTASANVFAIGASYSWQSAQSAGSSQRKLFLVTFDEPNRRQTCRIQSFTQDKLVCSRIVGGPRTYLPQQVLALILPGDHGLKLRIVLGLNVGIAAAIWGTVALAAACPACAVATGVVAFFLFGAAGAVLIGDEQPNRLLYLSPGQKLSRKLGFVEQ